MEILKLKNTVTKYTKTKTTGHTQPQNRDDSEKSP